MANRAVRAREIGGSDPQPLSQDDADVLNSSGIFTATRVAGRDGMWRVALKRNKAEVGSVRVGHLDVHIAPKLPIKRVLFLMGYAAAEQQRIRWRPETVGLDDEAGLVPVFAQMLWRRTQAALAGGILTGYVATDATSTVLRGRLRETDQLYQGRGLGYPLQVRYDDLTVDIAENQILRAALSRMLDLAGVDDESRRAMANQLGLLADVSTLPRHAPPPRWTPSRLNMRYAEALTLAELVLRERSAEHGHGDTSADGFLVDMEDIFEDFVRTAIGRELIELGGGWYGKPTDWYLDTTEQLKLEPDLAWILGDRPSAIVDAKYMPERSRLGGTREAIFQMLTYCTAQNLKEGHLVYAAGHAEPTTYTVGTSGIRIFCHALNLDQDPDDVIAQVKQLAEVIAAPILSRQAAPTADD